MINSLEDDNCKCDSREDCSGERGSNVSCHLGEMILVEATFMRSNISLDESL